MFPDEFHLATLQKFLSACASLHKSVNVKNIVISLLDRLAAFAKRDDTEGIPDDLQLFDIFCDEATRIIEARTDMPLQHALALYVSLTNLAISCYPSRLDHVDSVLAKVSELLTARSITNTDAQDPAAGRELGKLLRTPIDTYKNVLTVLK